MIGLLDAFSEYLKIVSKSSSGRGNQEDDFTIKPLIIFLGQAVVVVFDFLITKFEIILGQLIIRI